MSSSPIFKAALDLAERGLLVFPCRPNKAPACPGGFKAASSDRAIVAELWRRWPGSLIGVATGPVSNLAVLDIDKLEGGNAWWAEHRMLLPPTRAVRTRSGGLHLWFQNHPGLKCSVAAIAQGVDVRAEGGYVIDWPSAGFPVLRECELAPWPSWLNAALSRVEPQKPRQERLDRTGAPSSLQIKALLLVVSSAPKGERNARLFWAACRFAGLVATCLMPEAEAMTVLVDAAQAAGLPAHEARRTAKSGLKTGGIGQ